MGAANDKKDELMDLLEKPILTYIQHLMKELGHEVSLEEAGNLLANIGTHTMLKNLRSRPTPKLEEELF